MATIDILLKSGWYFTPQGLDVASKNGILKDIQSITRNACDIDIKEFGAPALPKEFESEIVGPIVLQIQKIRNISAPKSNELSNVAPRLLKFILTDGHSTCQALEFDSLSNLNITKTLPGTKIVVYNVPVVNNYLLLSNKCMSVLGGYVSVLAERWQLAKSITKHLRGLDGPPPWVPFGHKVNIQSSIDRNFKSFESAKDKEHTNDEFSAQRQGAIAEAAQGVVRKTFGGGIKSLPSRGRQNTNRRNNEIDHTKNKPVIKMTDDIRTVKSVRNEKRKCRDKEDVDVQKPSGHVSLFDFLENKLPPTITDGKFSENQKKFESNTSKVNRQNKLTYADKYDASSKYNNESIDTTKIDTSPPEKIDYRDKKTFEYKSSKTKPFVNYGNSKSYQGYCDKNVRHVNFSEKAPRFQKQQLNGFREPTTTVQQVNNQSNLVFDHFKHNLPYNQGRDKNVVENLSRKMHNLTTETSSDFEWSCETQIENRPSKDHDRHSNGSSRYNSEPKNQTYKNIQVFSQTENSSDYNYNDNYNKQLPDTSEWQWQVGDRCMAKYWEDNRYYDANITGVTNRTCVVRFNEYGNFEEVLKKDCIPLLKEDLLKNNPNLLPKTGNQGVTGNGDFYRGNINETYTKKFDRKNLFIGKDFRNH